MAISVPFECGAGEAELTLEKRLKALGCGNIRFQPVDYGVRLCAETADGEAFSLTLYFNQKNGRSTKLVTMGKAGNAGEGLAPQLALQACEKTVQGGGSARPVKELPELGEHIGTDESGKGDYFGPLVIAGVCADDRALKLLETLGACDSKLNSDKKNTALAAELRQALSPACIEIICISPEKYNALYARTGNLNTLLAWGHARVIENLLTANPNCRAIVADQFSSEHVLERALMERGRSARLFQTPKGERDAAVAAASVLARERYLASMARMSELCGFELQKGASPAVEQQARRLVRELGEEALRSYAKLHFKTTERVLS